MPEDILPTAGDKIPVESRGVLPSGSSESSAKLLAAEQLAKTSEQLLLKETI